MKNKIRNKTRVNWTLDPECVQILMQAKKLNVSSHTSLSSLVEYAIRKVFKNKLEMLREKARSCQKELMRLKDEIDMIEEKQKV